DETVLISDDAALVNAFRTRFDRMWNDTTAEPESFAPRPPYFKNWDSACALESACADYRTLYPSPRPMVVDTTRLEPDYPSPPDLVWSQGPAFNQRLIEEIARETTRVDLVAYRLTVSSVTDALIRRFHEGVPTRVIVDPEQYTSRVWPEYWLTHASVDRLWAAGVPIKQRRHAGLTHMKMLVTSHVATNASSNIAANWQRDHNYFVPAATKPLVHRAMQQRFDSMWADERGFEPFAPLPPDSPVPVSPEADASDVPTDTALVWRQAPFATSYDVYFGASASTMALVATVPAELVETPPLTYSWTPPPLARDTTFSWQVVSRTLAGLTAAGPVRQFRTPSVAEDVMVNFGPGGGLWRYRYRQPWTNVHSLSPKAMVAGDIDGNGIDELVMDFKSGGGLWILWNNATWSQLHAASAVAMNIGDLNGNGRADVILHFEGVGLYIWYDGSVWSFLHPYAPDFMLAANIDAIGGDDLIVSFPGRGVWAYRNASHWSRLHELNPQFVVAGQLDGQGGADLVLSYPPYGIWQYANDDAWSQIHSLNPKQVVAGGLDGRGPEDLVLDFGTGGGVWVRLNGTTWSLVHQASSEGLAVADLDGVGPDEVLIDFGADAGLWMLKRLTQWEQVHPLSPVDLSAIGLR
ncbi:MAG: phospholipase D family protein, partial [Vicinamibacterales bacterium]